MNNKYMENIISGEIVSIPKIKNGSRIVTGALIV